MNDEIIKNNITFANQHRNISRILISSKLVIIHTIIHITKHITKQ